MLGSNTLAELAVAIGDAVDTATERFDEVVGPETYAGNDREKARRGHEARVAVVRSCSKVRKVGWFFCCCCCQQVSKRDPRSGRCDLLGHLRARGGAERFFFG